MLDPTRAAANGLLLTTPHHISMACTLIFGQVTEGMDAVKNILPRDPQNTEAPATRIVSITIEEN